MAATVRFTEIVKAGGPPQIYLPLTALDRDRTFLKAQREQRIVSLKQSPTGTRKDFGVVAVLREKFVTYLIFPKSLKRFAGKRVIGIKYEKFETANTIAPAPPPKAKATKQQSRPVVKPVPQLKQFEVNVRTTATLETVQTLEAKTRKEAAAKARSSVGNDIPWPKAKISVRIMSITEKPGKAEPSGEAQ